MLAQSSFAQNSPDSAIRADDAALKRACAEAVEELKASRVALEKQGVLIEKQKELLEIETAISSRLRSIDSLSELEKTELRKALTAKDEAIAALEAEVKVLKKNRFTLWKAFKVGIVAGAAGIVLGKVF